MKWNSVFIELRFCVDDDSFLGFGIEGRGCVECVVDDDEVILPACCQRDGMLTVFAVSEVDGVVGVGDVEPAQEPGDVEGVFVPFGGDFHGQECFGICCLDGESVELFEFDPGGVARDESCGIGVEPVRREVVLLGHFSDDSVDGCFVRVAGIDIGGGAVADSLKDERGAPYEFHVAMDAFGV